MPMAVYLRHVDGSNHLLLEIQSAQARIYQKVNGVNTYLDLTDACWRTDAVLRCAEPRAFIFTDQAARLAPVESGDGSC